MTEDKRFYISCDSNQNIYDTMLRCYYSSIDAKKLCKLLNGLNEDRKIALDGIKIADELIRKYGSEELKLKWKKEVIVKYR